MTHLRWPEILFIICFLLFGVGGGALWPSDNVSDAVLALAAGTVVGIGVWLGILFVVVRVRRTEQKGDGGE